jgi:hypothetical protein
MRRSVFAALASVLALGAAALTGCHTHYRKPKTDLGALAAGAAERESLEETDTLIAEEADAMLASGGADRARLDRDARELGLSGAPELLEILDRDCAQDGEIARFASARGMSAGTAERYLAARFDVAVCGSAAP